MDEAALQRLLDESDLRNLIMGMPRCLDARNWDAYGELFTEDCVFTIAGQTRIGKKEIGDGPRGDLAVLYEGTQHHMGNIYVDIDGDRARLTAYVIAVHLPKTDAPFTHADVGGGYKATAVRTPDGWRLDTCDVFMSWMAGIPLAFNAPADAPASSASTAGVS